MAKAVRIEWNYDGFIEILNGPKMSEVLDTIAQFAEDTALAVYEAENKGQERGPVLYAESFFIRKVKKLAARGAQVQARQIGNSDPEWGFVEFGLWAGGSGNVRRVYKYAPLRRALDVLESGGAP